MGSDGYFLSFGGLGSPVEASCTPWEADTDVVGPKKFPFVSGNGAVLGILSLPSMQGTPSKGEWPSSDSSGGP